MNSKKSKELTEQLDSVVAQIAGKLWREMVVTRMATIGMQMGDSLELHITSETIDLELPQRAVNVFFTTFFLYPSSIAVHSTIAALLEASETILKANCRFIDSGTISARLLGEDFTALPIRIEIDDSLDTKTVAVRFKINLDEYEGAAKSIIMRYFEEDNE